MNQQEGRADLSGTIDRVIYQNSGNGWSVVSVWPDKSMLSEFGFQSVMVTGEFVEINEGEHIDIEGEWIVNPKYGHQLKLIRQKYETIFTKEGLHRFLSSGEIKGISDVIATAILNRFGSDLPDIIENHPLRLMEVPGVKQKKMESILENWKEKSGLRNLMIFLQNSNITNGVIVKIYKKWGELSIQNIQDNPYNIMRLSGIGFQTADQFALSLGLEFDSKERIIAGVEYALEAAARSGHTFQPIEDMIKTLIDLISVSGDRIRKVVHEYKHKLIICSIGNIKEAVFTRFYYNSEFYGALHMIRVNDYVRVNEAKGGRVPNITIRDDLTEEQMHGLQNVISNKISVITGGPGTGKSYCIRVLLDHLDRYGKSYSLAAPTGRAAKRIEETTGRKGMTLHRLLGLTPRSSDSAVEIEEIADNPLKSDFFIIDEYSMVDSWLNSKLFAVIPSTSHVLLVGDVDQLPSVGAGNTLRNIIDSDLFPVTRLNKIFRQDLSSDIVINAHNINQGKFFKIENKNGMYHFATNNGETGAKWIADEVFQRINNKFNIPFEDIQVLTPMYKGPCGVDALNASLRDKFNPLAGQPTVNSLTRIFRLGDRVMQTKNDYQLKVFNGDTGYIVGIESREKIFIEFDKSRIVEYTNDQLVNITLSYAMTIHKSQGCEYPGIIIALLPEHSIMLQRNLFYTAVTRAKQACCVVGDEHSMHAAVSNNEISKRYTALEWFLTHKESAIIEDEDPFEDVEIEEELVFSPV